MPYTSTSNSRRRKKKLIKKETSTIYIGLIAFLLISFYLIGKVYIFLTKQPIAIEEVPYGSIKLEKIYNGVVIRDEQIINSTVDGKVQYYFSEGEKVKKNAIVCGIKDTKNSDILEDKKAQYENEIINMQKSRDNISLVKDDVARIDENIDKISSNYITNKLDSKLNNLYNFKNQLNNEIELRNKLLLFEEKGSVKNLVEEKFIVEELLEKSITNIKSPISGIISFSTDKAEEMYSLEKIELLTFEQIKMKIEPSKKINVENVKVNEPIFKIINNDEWYIASYLPIEECQNWEIGNIKTLNFKDTENTYQNFKIKNIVKGVDKNLIIFSSDRNLLDYINVRSVSFEVSSKSYNGLKVPNTAIAERTFLKIPMDYIVENDEQYSIIKINGTSKEQIPIKIAFKDDTLLYAYILQDFNNIKIQDKLIKSDIDEEYIISESEVLTGIYVVNRGAAELKPIEITGKSETHSIIKPIGETSVRVYDKIISDAKNIQEGQLVY